MAMVEEIRSLEHLLTWCGEHEMALLYIGSDTCGICHDMLPKLVEMIKEYPQIVLAKVKIEDIPELGAAFQVFSVPAMLLLIEGKEAVRHAGIVSLQQMDRQIARHYAAYYSDV